jgi:hypothetical protein
LVHTYRADQWASRKATHNPTHGEHVRQAVGELPKRFLELRDVVGVTRGEGWHSRVSDIKIGYMEEHSLLAVIRWCIDCERT